jgi:hypothetical protein
MEAAEPVLDTVRIIRGGESVEEVVFERGATASN